MKGNFANEFPANIDKILKEIAEKYKMKLSKDTHYDAIDRVLSWTEGNIRKRLDFDLWYNEDKEFIMVTLYKDILPFCFCSRLLFWLDANMPELRVYPFFIKIEYEKLDDLPLGETQDFYTQKVQECIEYAGKIEEKSKRRAKKGVYN